jgi:ribonuclease D
MNLVEPITKPEELMRLVDSIHSVDEVCLDTEADSLHHYFEKICLLQFTIAKGDDLLHFLVDPLSGLDLAPLFAALKDKFLILHGADYDLRMLWSNYQFTPKAMFDTMLAARLTGQPGLGLDALVQRYAGQQLDHGSQKADWSKRPLTPRLLAYAVDDTRYLPLISQKLREELTALKRTVWHEQQCRHLIESCMSVRTKLPDEVWRIKGSFDLDRPSLAILRELWGWRDEEARQWDRPSFMICNNEKMLELVSWARQNPNGDLQKGPILPKRWPPRLYQALLSALRDAWNLPAEDHPHPPAKTKRPPYDPEFIPNLNRLRAARDQIAKSMNLDPSILAPNGLLETITIRRPKTLQEFDSIEKWLPWQTELLGKSFLEAITPAPQESPK